MKLLLLGKGSSCGHDCYYYVTIF